MDEAKLRLSALSPDCLIVGWETTLKNINMLIMIFFLASCKIPDESLLKADTSFIRDPRIVLENAVGKGTTPKFLYFDRSRKVIYYLGNPVSSLDFEKVDMDRLRSESPEVSKIVQCATGKSCSSSDYDFCKAVISLNNDVTDMMQNEIVEKLRSRGYPVVRVDFINRGGVTEDMEVQYFTKYSLIRGDIIENFPNLVSEK